MLAGGLVGLTRRNRPEQHGKNSNPFEQNLRRLRYTTISPTQFKNSKQSPGRGQCLLNRSPTYNPVPFSYKTVTMKPITRLSRVLLTDLPHATIAKPHHLTLTRRTIHTTQPTYKDDSKLTNPQQWRKAIWGEAGPADPYKELTSEEREKREIERIEAQEYEQIKKQDAKTEAERERQRAEKEATYAPDVDARDMIVAGTRGAFMKKKWDPKNRIWRFLLTRLENPEEVTAAVRRAVVETYSLAIAKSKPTQACVTYKGPEYLTEKVRITKTEDGKDYKFDFRSPDVARRIKEYAISQKQPLKSDLELVEGIERAEGDDWKSMTLGGASLKFAVLKRSMLLTGIPLTDPVMHAISTPGQLIKQFHRILAQGTSTRLAPALAENETISETPNVAIHQHQIKFTDKERAIGRMETIPIMMAGRAKREGEIVGRGKMTKTGRRLVSKSMLKLRVRKLKGWGVNGIDKASRISKVETAPAVAELQ
ncbi:hypothetical protein TWF569_007767 [Orbilia oligospora]|uniref:Large ribosomal subunit protein mL50 n=2 Tax=Orbilia oligospora TaxID=2813651 RepID=A0A7C8NIR6_ORBOL|nr:hypothetical protein TWF102_003406 [Orbilia oligospora]KAF3104695.1 hypothetical protein TWF706_004479 [Orbilia oligospora]KAF3115390.1 hypothetical protein TWF103_010819 [Orbilia oligospora]KAF3139718.1 hypothetical protein TWF594_006579 [Orbilia oligospora]KAF3141534.1 hypothetical protein TWF569_007767 [Orbilia oligospora]